VFYLLKSSVVWYYKGVVDMYTIMDDGTKTLCVESSSGPQVCRPRVMSPRMSLSVCSESVPS